MSVVTVTILIEGKALAPEIELLSVDVSKEVNRVPHAQIRIKDGDATGGGFEISDQGTFAPGRKAEIKLRYEGSAETTVFEGMIVGQTVEADAQGSGLVVELKDEAWKLTVSRKSKIFENQSDSEIIKTLVKGGGLKAGTVSATNPKHPEMVQYHCTDWDFLMSRADSQGLLVVVDDGTVSAKKINLSGNAKQRFEYGIDEIYDFEISADARYQQPEIASVGWDLKKQADTPEAKAAAFKLRQGNQGGDKAAKALGIASEVRLNSVPLSKDELSAWANAGMTRNRLAMIRGRLSVAGTGDFSCLDLIEVGGIGKAFDGTTMVTGVRHRVSANGWLTDLQFGLSADPFATDKNINEAQAAGLLPAVSGLQIGIVSGFEEDPEKELRVRVTLPSVDGKEGKIWARLASPDAGMKRGWFFRPETGDEVILGFFNNDPRHAVILGAMFGSKNEPPSDMPKPSDKNTHKAIVARSGSSLTFIDEDKPSVFIETPAKNKVIFDDENKAIELSDQHGNKITMDKDGVTIKSAKDLKIEASGNVEIKGSKVDIK